jgi:hypothetical protein
MRIADLHRSADERRLLSQLDKVRPRFWRRLVPLVRCPSGRLLCWARSDQLGPVYNYCSR